MALVPSTSFDENTPPGTEDKSNGDNRIREMKKQEREIISADHVMEATGQGEDWGQHKQITLKEQADLGTGAVNANILGIQTVDSRGELVLTNEDDTDIQITSGDKLNTAILKDGVLSTGITVASANIVDGTIVNADINASAAIDATKIGNGDVTNTELSYIKDVTSDVQTQLDAAGNATFDTGWTNYITATWYTEAHGLGARPARVEVHLRGAITSGMGGSTTYTKYWNIDTNGNGTYVDWDETNIYIRSNGAFAFLAINAAGTGALHVNSSLGYRIQAWAE